MAEIQNSDHGSSLAERHCVACRGGTLPLDAQAIESLRRQVEGWEVVDGHHLRKVYRFADFRTALAFVNRVGEVSESEGHHPDIAFGWGRAEITLWTHAADGLTENDFILAARIDRL
ncbi:MAG TPA: 4a-hydroxytetrahydrobiopterin dehydratase [Terriglobia bacterium]|jgi:4a-hydroxytetrahydrobiopterin dehydratase|nr:4a-hydroxytetrahydrobiopterin dehydratase [Terriglobia bacterium]